jgi:hypothetical protein
MEAFSRDPLGDAKLITQIKARVIIIMASLVFSGLTAFPIEWELHYAYECVTSWNQSTAFSRWIELVFRGVHDTNVAYPFIAYGSDWLGFAHLVIAIAFCGPLKDPVRNRWVIEFGIISCLLIFPFAFFAGHIRQIPIFWRLIDCSFGIIGGVILWNCLLKIRALEKNKLSEYECKC